ncbi:MAG TPA: J domain-containing protein [Phycisphaerae bacterium]|nr:J domain-containing protein [Phycisphaerae bacterium]
MAEQLDPYQVLGVGPGAGREEIRRAFRRAVLQCHPDRCPDDAATAMQRFRLLVEAYRRLRGIFAAETARDDKDDLPDERFAPSDFAWLSSGWEGAPTDGLSPDKLEWCPNVVPERVVQPATNETAVFVLCWVAAVVLALGAGLVAIIVMSWGGELGGGAAVVFFLAAIGTYVAVLLVALALIVASRRVAWLFRIVGFVQRHLLPRPPKDRSLTHDQAPTG